ncbi:OmpA family protein [Actinocorallia longicatena]|uniref:OmpA-like domain-containing protein n=1 Tax=Actinocorallia longicatena TaxID=111803 RepID=A0ABP6QIM8_9ACTN
MRKVLPSAVLAVVLLGGAARAEPAADELARSVRTVDATARDLLPQVLSVNIAESVVPLESERAQGSGTVLTVSSDILFDFGAAELTSPALDYLAKIAPKLRGAKVTVVGHTDAIGTPAANLKLSLARARAVRDALLRLGVTGVTARGRGESAPVAPNRVKGKDDPQGRALNRRVEIGYRTA